MQTLHGPGLGCTEPDNIIKITRLDKRIYGIPKLLKETSVGQGHNKTDNK